MSAPEHHLQKVLDAILCANIVRQDDLFVQHGTTRVCSIIREYFQNYNNNGNLSRV